MVYADESGITLSDDYCVVAGFMAMPSRWRVFVARWKRILLREGIKEFKSSQFFHRESAAASESNPFVGWNEDKGLNFIEELANTIVKSKLVAVRGAVNVKDFMQFSESQRRILTQAYVTPVGRIASTGSPNKPYHLAFYNLVREAAMTSAQDSRIQFIFDEQDVEAPLARQTYQKLRKYKGNPWRDKLGLLYFEDSAVEPGLQAADLYAHIWNRQLAYPERMGDERTWAKVLLDGVQSNIGIWNKATMVKYLQGLGPTRLKGLSERYDSL